MDNLIFINALPFHFKMFLPLSPLLSLLIKKKKKRHLFLSNLKFYMCNIYSHFFPGHLKLLSTNCFLTI